MNRLLFITKVRDLFFSRKALKVCGFLFFTIIMTAVIASQNFFFQGIIANGISKKDIIDDYDHTSLITLTEPSCKILF